MSLTGLTDSMQRGPSGPRLPVRLALLLAVSLPLTSCGHFGPGLAELPAAQGWQVMPVTKWVIDDAIRPRAVVFCPAETCPSPALVAVFRVTGQEAGRLEQLIGQDPARLLRTAARPAARQRPAVPAGKSSNSSKRSESGKPSHPGSRTTVEKIGQDGLTGARITLQARSEDARTASGVVLYRRDGPALTIALAVTTDPDKALAHAKAGLASLW